MLLIKLSCEHIYVRCIRPQEVRFESIRTANHEFLF